METFPQTCNEYFLCGFINEFDKDYLINNYYEMDTDRQRAYDKHGKTILDKKINGGVSKDIDAIYRNTKFYTYLIIIDMVALFVYILFF